MCYFFKNNFIFVTLECDNSIVLKILNNNNINEQLIIFLYFKMYGFWMEFCLRISFFSLISIPFSLKKNILGMNSPVNGVRKKCQICSLKHWSIIYNSYEYICIELYWPWQRVLATVFLTTNRLSLINLLITLTIFYVKCCLLHFGEWLP